MPEQSAEQGERRPVITKLAFTYDLTGPCCYCGKKCTRQRTFYASTQILASGQASEAMANLCHRKCGGY